MTGTYDDISDSIMTQRPQISRRRNNNENAGIDATEEEEGGTEPPLLHDIEVKTKGHPHHDILVDLSLEQGSEQPNNLLLELTHAVLVFV